MPAGSGPQVARVTTGSPAAAEVVVATLPPMNWSPITGMLLGVSVNFVPGTGQTTTTLRVRQGAGTGGALVGVIHPDTTVAGVQGDLAFTTEDTSPFATGGQQGGQYTLTIQTNAAGPGTIIEALLTAETAAPIQ